MSKRSILLAAAAALGLGVGHTAAAAQPHRPVAVVDSSNRAASVIPADSVTGGFNIGAPLLRGVGCPPRIWGESRAGARMVRKNRRIARRAR